MRGRGNGPTKRTIVPSIAATEDSGLNAYKCPFCVRWFGGKVAADPPVNEIGQDFRDHLRADHPVEDQDLRTTRWQNDRFVRCDPPVERSGPRPVPRRRDPPAGHGLLRLLPLDVPESDDGPLAIFCECGFQDVATRGRDQAMACLEWHWGRGNRLRCPICDWPWESDVLESVERDMARHLGMSHAERFPWGYRGTAEPLRDP